MLIMSRHESARSRIGRALSPREDEWKARETNRRAPAEARVGREVVEVVNGPARARKFLGLARAERKVTGPDKAAARRFLGPERVERKVTAPDRAAARKLLSLDRVE
jgi:hypothetical protein